MRRTADLRPKSVAASFALARGMRFARRLGGQEGIQPSMPNSTCRPSRFHPVEVPAGLSSIQCEIFGRFLLVSFKFAPNNILHIFNILLLIKLIRKGTLRLLDRAL